MNREGQIQVRVFKNNGVVYVEEIEEYYSQDTKTTKQRIRLEKL